MEGADKNEGQHIFPSRSSHLLFVKNRRSDPPVRRFYKETRDNNEGKEITKNDRKRRFTKDVDV
jgi:hypothetical protein